MEINITPKLLEELSKYEKLVVVRELDLFGCEWVTRIAAQNSEGLIWNLPLSKD